MFTTERVGSCFMWICVIAHKIKRDYFLWSLVSHDSGVTHVDQHGRLWYIYVHMLIHWYVYLVYLIYMCIILYFFWILFLNTSFHLSMKSIIHHNIYQFECVACHGGRVYIDSVISKSFKDSSMSVVKHHENCTTQGLCFHGWRKFV